MHKVFTIAITLIMLMSGCGVSGIHHDPWFGPDKIMHFTASSAISFIATSIALENGASDEEAVATGTATVIAAGCAKEYFDVTVKGTFWSWKDMTYNTAGGIAGGYGAVASDK